MQSILEFSILNQYKWNRQNHRHTNVVVPSTYVAVAGLNAAISYTKVPSSKSLLLYVDPVMARHPKAEDEQPRTKQLWPELSNCMRLS